MNKESFAINLLKNSYIGDDGAVIGEWVYSKDIFAEDIHFKREWMSLEQIAQKAMLVNISDAIAMNAKPLYALIGTSLPSDFSYKEIKKLSEAFRLTCKEWGVELIGGDTTSGKNLTISITIISKSKNPVFRSGMKRGDLIAHTGELGQSLKGLKALLRGGKLSKEHKFIKPKLRSDFFYRISPFVSSALDISDGLGKDLSRLSEINKLGFKFRCKMEKAQLCSGEEYEMLFSFHPRFYKRILSEAKRTKTPLNIVAKAVRGKYKSPCREHHFKN
ncbi:MAG: thiamine-phosphate kinase [Proteobacteria bacterium]|nr:MAG: thiamine-phosphate kinase [Pseudomonadota bacterium]